MLLLTLASRPLSIHLDLVSTVTSSGHVDHLPIKGKGCYRRGVTATAPHGAGPTTEEEHLDVRLALIGGFELRRSHEHIYLPTAVQRVVAFLGLQERPVQRAFVAGTLWTSASEHHASASLRSAMWRLGRQLPGLVRVVGPCVGLGQPVPVDVREIAGRARSVLADPGARNDDDLAVLAGAGEVLPDWYDDWVLAERERFRLLRLHALEALSAAFLCERRFARAAEAGLAAVNSEPLRESAQRALIAVHLAEGNASEALRQYGSFRSMLRERLGVQPSPSMEQLISSTRA